MQSCTTHHWCWSIACEVPPIGGSNPHVTSAADLISWEGRVGNSNSAVNTSLCPPPSAAADINDSKYDAVVANSNSVCDDIFCLNSLPLPLLNCPQYILAYVSSVCPRSCVAVRACILPPAVPTAIEATWVCNSPTSQCGSCFHSLHPPPTPSFGRKV